MKTRLCLAIVVVLAMWSVKRHYAGANADDLWWILSPTARLVGATTSTAFVVAPGEGYFSRERLFLIEKSCAGINFMIAAFGMLAFTLSARADSWRSAGRAFAVSAAAGYSTAVLVNTVRIVIAMWLAARTAVPFGLTGVQVHRLEGIVVYFGGLVLLHELVRQFDSGLQES